jgi:hypothetical protein
MTERALKGFSWFHFRAAAWWLGLLYRRPKHFREALESLPRMRMLRAGAILMTYALIYMIIIAGAVRLLLLSSLAFYVAVLLVLGLAGVIARKIAGGSAEGFALAAAGGTSLGFALVLAPPGTEGVAGEIAVGIVFGIVFEIAFEDIVFGIVFGILGGLLGGIVRGTTEGAAFVMAFWIAYLRAYYYPWHLILLFFAPTATGYRWHPVAWDDMCSLPFVGLNRFLFALCDASPELAVREINRLTHSYPSQRMEALKARAVVIAREAGASANLARLDDIVNRLPEGEKRFLAETPRVREMVAGIAEAQRRVNGVDRPFLRQPYAEALVSKIEAFRGQISGFHEPLASEFRKAADAWLKRARAQLKQIKTITGREPTPQVFRAGDPVDRSREAFVPRLGVIGQVERQVTLANGCPSLLIYGRRRMGKSTVIRNLDAFVPDTVCIASVSMQDPKLFSSTASFVRQINKAILAALKHEIRALKSEDLGGLFDRLTLVDSGLKNAGLRLILAFDEFENIDTKISEGVISSDLLAAIRQSVQSHRRLIWVFAGSHRVTMLKNAEWPSYLISVQTIEIPPFTQAETRLLLTDPLQQSPLYARDAERPCFDSSFWGEGGIAWIHAQTAGWPHLVQLLASGAVDYANESETARLDGRALEEVARRAIVSGNMVLYQLVHGESQSEAERAYVAGFRTKDSQPPPEDEATLVSLRHREIIAEDGGVWRLKVPLMQQWLRTRG